VDVMMARMGGLQFIEEVERRGWRARYRIVMMTAYTGLDDQVAALGVDRFVVKPFLHPEFLVREIGDLIGDRGERSV